MVTNAVAILSLTGEPELTKGINLSIHCLSYFLKQTTLSYVVYIYAVLRAIFKRIYII